MAPRSTSALAFALVKLIAVGLTALSGVHYLWNGRGILRDAQRGS